MKLIILYFLILIVLLLIFNTSEKMTDIIPYNKINNNLKINFNVNNTGMPYRDKLDDHTTEIIDNRMKFINIAPLMDNSKEDNNDYTNEYSNLTDNKNTNCCLVSKDIYNNFKFEQLYNDKCNIDLYDTNQDRQLLFDGVNDWDNNFCANNLDNQPLGSCRNDNHECVNFMNKTKCESVNGLTWSEKSCSIPVLKKVTFKEYDLKQL